MLKRSEKQLRLRTLKHYGEIPKPQKNEILVATQEDRLLDSGMPFMNRGNRPSWWSSLPSSKGSYRRCYGITDLMQMGFTVPMWADVSFTHSDNKALSVRTSHQGFIVESFQFDQVGHCPITSDRTFQEIAFPKLVSPFQIRTPKGWSVLAFQHPFLYSKDYQVFPGVIHTDFYHEMNVVVNIMSAENFVIKAGTPVLYCLPFRRKDSNILSMMKHAGSEVADLMHGYGMGYSGIPLFSEFYKGLYRQRLKKFDS
jgi:hypothetical protein